jgi:hypothetical protein
MSVRRARVFEAALRIVICYLLLPITVIYSYRYTYSINKNNSKICFFVMNADSLC